MDLSCKIRSVDCIWTLRFFCWRRGNTRDNDTMCPLCHKRTVHGTVLLSSSVSSLKTKSYQGQGCSDRSHVSSFVVVADCIVERARIKLILRLSTTRPVHQSYTAARSMRSSIRAFRIRIMIGLTPHSWRHSQILMAFHHLWRSTYSTKLDTWPHP